VKLSAASSATTVNIAYTAARSRAEPSTVRSTSGVRPAATRCRVHRTNACPSTMPTTTRTGAGDTPARSNGAPGDASSGPHALRFWNPVSTSATAAATRTAPTPSSRTVGSPGTGGSRALSTSTATASASATPNTGRQPTNVPSTPPSRKAATPASARAEPSDPIAVACWSPR
jgi:hypothetical protein